MRCSEEKIISILKEHEAGDSTPDLSHRHGVSEQSTYRWKEKFVGMELSDAKRLRELEAENRKIKLLPDLTANQVQNARYHVLWQNRAVSE